jgi:hypothetical protein
MRGGEVDIYVSDKVWWLAFNWLNLRVDGQVSVMQSGFWKTA